MQKISKTVLLTFLMIILGLSAATNSLNESTETTVLDEISAPQEVILPIASLNEPGHQEGSIFTDTTLSSGRLTPAQFSMTVLSHVGEKTIMASWATVEHLM